MNDNWAEEKINCYFIVVVSSFISHTRFILAVVFQVLFLPRVKYSGCSREMESSKITVLSKCATLLTQRPGDKLVG